MALSALLNVQNLGPGNVLAFWSDLTSPINKGSLFSATPVSLQMGTPARAPSSSRPFPNPRHASSRVGPDRHGRAPVPAERKPFVPDAQQRMFICPDATKSRKELLPNAISIIFSTIPYAHCDHPLPRPLQTSHLLLRYLSRLPLGGVCPGADRY